ncbi:MAG: YdcF family protein [Sphingomicrobium sp.]
MIWRFGSALLLLYALGFVLFAVTLGKPADAQSPSSDAGIVLTGGDGRIERGVAVLKSGKVKRLLVAGADPLVAKRDIARRVPGSGRWIRCCVDLGTESVDTRSNAAEAERWLEGKGFRSYRLITSDWHMRRARFEFEREIGDERTMVIDAVRTEPRLMTIFKEYNKYLFRRLGLLVGI